MTNTELRGQCPDCNTETVEIDHSGPSYHCISCDTRWNADAERLGSAEIASKAKNYNNSGAGDGLLMCTACGELAVLQHLEDLTDVDLAEVLGPDPDDWPLARLVWACQRCGCAWDLTGKATWTIQTTSPYLESVVEAHYNATHLRTTWAELCRARPAEATEYRAALVARIEAGDEL